MKTLFLILLAALSVPAHASAWQQNAHTDRGRVHITFSSMLEAAPLRGYVPLRIQIRNHSPQPSSWDFRFASSLNWNMEQGASRTAFRAELEGSEERVFEVMLPVHPSPSGGSSPRIQATLFGPGINNNTLSLWGGGGGWRSSERFYAISRSLAGRNQSALQQAISGGSGRGGDDTVAIISLEDLSDDPRAYSGIDVILLTLGEWNGLERGHRYVLRQWAARGGQLLLATKGENPAPLELPEWSDSGIRLGWGQVLPVKLEGELLNPEDIKTRTHAFSGPYPLNDNSVFQSGQWTLRREIPDLNPPLGLLFLFVFAIAILLGPVNVITALRQKKAVRLLWVTPLASVVLSLILITGIVLVDGFGGYGHRVATVFLMPGDNLEIVHQEQVARTGVLLQRAFNVAPGTVMLPVNTEHLNRPFGHFTLDGHRWDGDWFRSRSIQGQLLQISRPSRGRIELIRGPGGPQIFSEVDARLQTLFLKDSDGGYWTVNDLHAGQRKALQPATQAEARAFVESLRLRRDERVTPVQTEGGFIASAAPAEDKFLPSYGAIRWRTQHLRYTGMIQERIAP
ncbi:MAG: hypothetical protein JJU05_07695 [Verrucomicrobia bacterium]|nr:hypothetical protein [Verrucomicrobiota bacterium]MCH8528748.1 hypothetical protein [Kiritimatiellia bacterium]